MFCRINGIGLNGLNAYPVDVEVEMSRGLERFDIVGLADAAVRESRERIKSAFRSSGIKFPGASTVINLAPAAYENLSSDIKEEPSAVIRERVQCAREIQNERFSGTGISCNARITPDILRDVCRLTDGANALLKDVFDRLGLSARAYDKILKVARTVADMDGAADIDRQHISQAVRYRTLDRKFWVNE